MDQRWNKNEAEVKASASTQTAVRCAALTEVASLTEIVVGHLDDQIGEQNTSVPVSCHLGNIKDGHPFSANCPYMSKATQDSDNVILSDKAG